MWGMAKGTPLRLYRWVLINPWPERVDVALSADSILGRTQVHHFWLKGSMGIMAIGALNQPFRNPVVKRLFKCRMNVRVALITDRWLLRLQ